MKFSYILHKNIFSLYPLSFLFFSFLFSLYLSSLSTFSKFLQSFSSLFLHIFLPVTFFGINITCAYLVWNLFSSLSLLRQHLEIEGRPKISTVICPEAGSAVYLKCQSPSTTKGPKGTCAATSKPTEHKLLWVREIADKPPHSLCSSDYI